MNGKVAKQIRKFVHSQSLESPLLGLLAGKRRPITYKMVYKKMKRIKTRSW